jgi:hypothetical protein
MDNQEQLLPLLDMVVVVVENGNSLSGSVEMARMAHNYYFTCPNNNTNAGSNQTLAVCATTTLVQIHLHMETVHGRSFQVQTISNPTSYFRCNRFNNRDNCNFNGLYQMLHVAYILDINTEVSGEGCLSYCTPSVSNGYQQNYINVVIGNITNSNNTSTYSASPLGYQNRTTSSRATQAQGEV